MTDIPINQIILGDNRDILPDLPSKIAGGCITDPPYGMAFESNYFYGRRQSARFEKIEGDTVQELKGLLWKSFHQTYRILKRDSHFYSFCSWKTLTIFINALDVSGFNIKNFLIGKRSTHSLGDLNYAFAPYYESILFAQKGKREFNKTTIRRLYDGNGWVRRFDDLIDFIPVSEPDKSSIIHPTQKSLDIIEFFLLLSTNPGDLVIDPFSGSGVLAVACSDLGRDFLCIEKDKVHYDNSLKLLQRFKAGKLDDKLKGVHRRLNYYPDGTRNAVLEECF